MIVMTKMGMGGEKERGVESDGRSTFQADGRPASLNSLPPLSVRNYLVSLSR